MSVMIPKNRGQKLDQLKYKNWQDFPEDTFEKEEFLRDLRRTSEAFQQQFPQVPLTEHNLSVIHNWLKEHGVAGNSMNNMRQLVEGACANLIFAPSACGVSAEPGTGASLMKQLDSVAWQTLIAPKGSRPAQSAKTTSTFAEAKSLDDSQLSAEAYKAKHPEGWKDLRDQVQKAEMENRQKAVEGFLQMHAEYKCSDESLALIVESLRGLPCTAANLSNVYQALVREGRLEVNKDVLTKQNGLTSVNYAKSENRSVVYPNQKAEIPPKKMGDAALDMLVSKISQMSSQEYLHHLNTNAAFRDRVNAMGR